jgi:hypothetical protein
VTLNNTIRRPSRSLRTTFGLVLVSVVLGGTLTACGSEAENTTCKELKSKNTDDTLSFIRDAAEDDGSDNADDLIDQLDKLGDDKAAKEAAANTLKSTVCDGQDDDTKLKDTPLYE